MVAIWRLRLGALESPDQHFTRVISSGLQEKVTGYKAQTMRFGNLAGIFRNRPALNSEEAVELRSLPNPD